MRRFIVFAVAVVATLALASGEAPAATDTVTVTVQVVGNGKVTAPGIDCGLGSTTCQTAIAGTTAMKFDAVAGDKSVFAGWSGDCSGTTTPCLLVIPDGTDVTVRAVFAWVEVVAVQLQGTGQGSVVSNPAGLSCGALCATAFAGDTSVTLTAVPKPGSTFSGWGGWCSGRSPTCTVRATGTAAVTARFDSETTGGGTATGANASGGLVFTPAGWDVQNPDGTRYVAVDFRTSSSGSVGL